MKLLYLLLCISLVGCATSEDYNAYLRSQHELNVAHVASQKPLVEIEAVEGQQITGLKALRIYTPSQAPMVQQKAPNEWVSVVSQGLGILGMVAGISVSNKGMVDLTNAVGNATSMGYRNMQSPVIPQANVTTTTNTYSPISNTTNTNTSSSAYSSSLSGQGVLGNGSFSVPTTNTTTSNRTDIDASQRVYSTPVTPIQ